MIEELVQDQLAKGVIERSTSTYTSQVLLIPKAGTTKMRFCVSYTELNKILEDDLYPLPRVDECLSELEGNQYFSSCDLMEAF